MKFVNQRRCASTCTVMLAQNVARVLQKALARIAVAQKLGDCHFKGIDIANLDRAFLQDECFRKCREVFHVRSKHDWFAGHNRLHRILTALRGQAFPNEYNGGDTIPELKFAGCIEKDTIRI